jgi:hypothetical protein
MAKILEFRPICINKGCKKPVTYSYKNPDGTHRWKPVCGHCRDAQTGKSQYAKGVTPYRTGVCENKDGKLGFKCAVNHKMLPKDMHLTEIDHKKTQVEFFLEFEFNSILLGKMLSAIFSSATQKMMNAFENRALTLYKIHH